MKIKDTINEFWMNDRSGNMFRVDMAWDDGEGIMVYLKRAGGEYRYIRLADLHRRYSPATSKDFYSYYDLTS